MVVTLSSGVIAVAVTFGILDAAFWRPFDGVLDQKDLVRISFTDSRGAGGAYTPVDLAERLTESVPAVRAIGFHEATAFSVQTHESTIRVGGALVSPGFLQTLGISATTGRLPVRDSVYEAVMRPGLARELFGTAESAIGQHVTINGRQSRIVGLTPERFRGIHDPAYPEDVWIVPPNVSHHGPSGVAIVARVIAGTNAGTHREELRSYAASHFGTRNEDVRVHIERLRRANPRRLSVVLLLAGAALLVGISCFNAASLVLARSFDRFQPWRLRFALGASRWDLIRQQLTEDVLIATLAFALGLAGGFWALWWLDGQIPLDLRLDLRVAVSTALTTFAVPLLFGSVPVLRFVATIERRSPSSVGRYWRPDTRGQAAITTLQFAASFALVASSAQFLHSLKERHGDDGLVRPDSLLVARTGRTTPSDADLYAELRRQLRSHGLTGVAASCDCILWQPSTDSGRVRVWHDRTGPSRQAVGVHAGGDFFDLLGLTIVAGRGFQSQDHTSTSQAIIVNRAYEAAWLDGEALGKRISISPVGALQPSAHGVVVGVTDTPVDASDGTPALRRADIRPALFYPAAWSSLTTETWYLRFSSTPSADARALAASVLGRVGGRIVHHVSTASDLRNEYEAPRRWTTATVVCLAGLAVLLALGGTFSYVSFLVAQRRREIGTRLALGSSPGLITVWFLRRTVRAAAIGCVLGGVTASLAAALLRSPLFGASRLESLPIAEASAVIVVLLLSGALWPAVRATRIDLPAVLRDE